MSKGDALMLLYWQTENRNLEYPISAKLFIALSLVIWGIY